MRGSQTMRKTSRFQRTVLGFVFWTAIGLLLALSRIGNSQRWQSFGNGQQWQSLLTVSLVHLWIWGLLTPLIIAVDRRLPFSKEQMGRRIGAHLILGPLWTMLFIYAFTTFSAAAGYRSWSSRWDDLVQSLFWHMPFYLLIVGISQAYQYQQRYVSAELQMERLERSSSEARLNALRMQLDPHFLFNALNTISAQVSADPKLARKMIEHLGNLLRLSLESQGRQEITLAEEVAFLDHYLAIQRIRFGDNLQIQMDISVEAQDALVPSLFLQPLVENAIRHGISPRSAGGTIIVSARRLSNLLDVQIVDDGVGLPSDWSLDSRKGLGLTLTKERIAGLHPEGTSQFNLVRRPDGGTQVKISFPFRPVEAR